MESKYTIDILVFVPGDFDEVFVKKALIPLSQSDFANMYVINRPADLLIDGLKGFKRLKKRFVNKNPINQKIKIFTPFVLLNEVIHESLLSCCNFNMKILLWQVKKLIKREGIDPQKLILWCYHPLHWKAIKEIPAKARVYEVYDEYCYNQKDRLRESTYNAEKKMILFCDEIICSSEKLKEKFEKIVPREKIHLISTPADNRSFQECKVKEYLHWDIIPSPKLVIFGVIRYQTDLALIEKLALMVPAVSIVFIGKNQSRKLKPVLKKYQNIYHLGYLSYEKANYCLRSAAIGLYPARKCKYSTYANPNRIYEYAAAGIPVVASNINRETDFPESIVVTDNDTDFIRGIQNILKRGISKEDKEELIAFAKRHSGKENARKYMRIFQAANST